MTTDVELRVVDPAWRGHAERVRGDALAEPREERQPPADRGPEGANRRPGTCGMRGQAGGPRDVHVGVGSLDVEKGRVECCEALIHPARRMRSGPAMTVGIRITSSTGASRKRRGRESVRGIGMSTYFLVRGEGALSMHRMVDRIRPRVIGPTVGNRPDRRYYFGSEGSMMRNAFRPSPRRSRSSVFIGS